ncbi:MAG: Jag N-terminal domain-containing protein [Acidimicrobiia bacterium]|nr:Jag N-terminal domain-containing protein [Acidimicrobiia bacterium]
MEEWVEIRAKTVEAAIEAGLRELGLESSEAAEIEVLQEAQKGFLGFGGEPALVRMKAKPKRRRRRRPKAGGSGQAGGSEARMSRGRGDRREESRPGSRGGSREGSSRGRSDSGRREGQGRQGQGRSSGRSTESRQSRGGEGRPTASPRPTVSAPSPADVAEQAGIVREFLVGLVEAFGLEGEVNTRVEGDIIYAEVTGDQTEALVGPKGAILDAVMELCRTMVHRHSQSGARLRLDIAGYAERRREALRIYARRLAEKVVAEGGEIMLEPMNPADRKVVHDAIAEIDGVRSFSEGEDPERSVVIAPDEDDEDEED